MGQRQNLTLFGIAYAIPFGIASGIAYAVPDAIPRDSVRYPRESVWPPRYPVRIGAPNLNNGGWGRSPKIMPKTTSHPGKGEQAVHVGPEPVTRKPCSGATWGAKFYNFHARVLHKLPSIPSLLN